MNRISVFFTLSLLLVLSCKSKEKNQAKQEMEPASKTSSDYLSLVMSQDTFSNAGMRRLIYERDSLLNLTEDKERNPFYHYFKGRKYSIEQKPDSAIAAYETMKAAADTSDITLLKEYSILDKSISNGGMVKSALMNRIFSTMQKAEQTQSKLAYRFYDLQAKAYYQNHNEKEALVFAERYYKNHPYKSHPVVTQRYYDISFLLAAGMNNYKKMRLYNMKARDLAKGIGDSLAIARTYDNEAQIYDRQGQHKKSLVCSKIYFDYLKHTNNLNDIAYNNLATSFIHNHQPDSAIYYYKEGLVFMKKDPRENPKAVYYNGLAEAYKMKKNYVNAMQALDSAYSIEIRNIKGIEDVKIAELHEKYEAEKKDQNIKALDSRNRLNEKIIHQQRWTLISALLILLGILSFFYVLYRQQRLKAKNKLLQSENERLNIEQKLLQAQLNPHFIFNAIANLQSLIATGDTKESVRYLSFFSQLLRNTLEQSRKDFIGLDEEITSLHNYLELQQMRFAGLFDYQLTIPENINPENTLIPPMLVQPFVENAIEHGFRNINYKGILTITFKVIDNNLIITVDDNGNGISEKEISTQKKQSLAQIILKERLAAGCPKTWGKGANFEIEDKKNGGERGVRVRIVIPEIKN